MMEPSPHSREYNILDKLYKSHCYKGLCKYLDSRGYFFTKSLCPLVAIKEGYCKEHYIEEYYPNSGYIYLFYLGWKSYYKLGRSFNWEQRLNNFKTSNPFIKKVHIIRVNDTYEIEELLINKYEDKIFQNEIFNLNGEDVVSIVDDMNKYQITI